ncbi:MAG: PQQ-binding-like beta-propeller repeat protein [Gammaproteobacteria bacterium]
MNHPSSLRPRFAATLVCLALTSLVSCTEHKETPAETAESPSTLASTDEFQTAGSELGPRDGLPGKDLFNTHCASCHNGSVYKAPHTHWLEMLPSTSLYSALDSGVMAAQAANLSDAEKVHIVEYLSQKRFDPQAAQLKHNFCTGSAATFDTQSAAVKVGWGHDTKRFVDAEHARLAVGDIPNLKLKWSYVYPGASRARSQPGYGMGALYVGSEAGIVYAFDLATGCVRWAFQAKAEVRTGAVYNGNADQPMVFFGDIVANAYGVDARTGELRWTRRVDPHPSATVTGTPAVHDDHVYFPVSSLEVIAAADPAYECCSFRGKVVAINGGSGDVAWESYAIEAPPEHVADTSAGTRILAPSGAPVWNSPTVDAINNRLYFGTGENYSTPADGNSDAIVAVDLDTGERMWEHQITANDAWNVACMMDNNPNCPDENGPDYDQGSSPLLVTLDDGTQTIVAGHKSGHISGHNPAQSGKQLWRTKVGRGSIQGGVHFGMAAEGERVYMPINDMNDTHNGDVHDVTRSQPGMHAINAATGEKLWSTVADNICTPDREFCDPGISAPATAVPGAVFAGHLDGRLRAYDGATGAVLWDYDTTQPTTGVNGMEGRGGGMSGAGPLVIDGHVVANSGYGLYFHEAGNVLLVFSVDGE